MLLRMKSVVLVRRWIIRVIYIELLLLVSLFACGLSFMSSRTKLLWRIVLPKEWLHQVEATRFVFPCLGFSLLVNQRQLETLEELEWSLGCISPFRFMKGEAAKDHGDCLIVEHSGNMFGRELVRCVRDKKASFFHSTITDNDTSARLSWVSQGSRNNTGRLMPGYDLTCLKSKLTR